MSPADAVAPLANGLLVHITAFVVTVTAGVIVSLMTLRLADRQRTRQEERAEAHRR